MLFKSSQSSFFFTWNNPTQSHCYEARRDRTFPATKTRQWFFIWDFSSEAVSLPDCAESNTEIQQGRSQFVRTNSHFSPQCSHKIIMSCYSGLVIWTLTESVISEPINTNSPSHKTHEQFGERETRRCVLLVWFQANIPHIPTLLFL